MKEQVFRQAVDFVRAASPRLYSYRFDLSRVSDRRCSITKNKPDISPSERVAYRRCRKEPEWIVAVFELGAPGPPGSFGLSRVRQWSFEFSQVSINQKQSSCGRDEALDTSWFCHCYSHHSRLLKCITDKKWNVLLNRRFQVPVPRETHLVSCASTGQQCECTLWRKQENTVVYICL